MSKVSAMIFIITSILARIVAYIETDLKKIVAISTLSQLGIMLYTLSLAEINFSYFHIITHAIFKALLFLSCGILILISSGGQDTRKIRTIAYLAPIASITIIVSSLRLIGFPFLAGFYSKDAILETSMSSEDNTIIILLLIICCILTVIYTTKLNYNNIMSTFLSEKYIQIKENKQKTLIIIPLTV
jgi:NADH:ubiquinone oxidoreductase subunit 5 (subunit L)/multisubunit Na+/H+ antiporter MnhA subunit